MSYENTTFLSANGKGVVFFVSKTLFRRVQIGLSACADFQLNKHVSIYAMNMATNYRIFHSIFQQNTIVDCSCTFLASEFIALIADKLQLQPKSSEVVNF